LARRVKNAKDPVGAGDVQGFIDTAGIAAQDGLAIAHAATGVPHIDCGGCFV
jgi:hypothetical protein